MHILRHHHQRWLCRAPLNSINEIESSPTISTVTTTPNIDQTLDQKTAWEEIFMRSFTNKAFKSKVHILSNTRRSKVILQRTAFRLQTKCNVNGSWARGHDMNITNAVKKTVTYSIFQGFPAADVSSSDEES